MLAAVGELPGQDIGRESAMQDAQRQADFASVYDRYGSLHETHMKKLRLAVLSGLPLDVGTFSADADELKSARDELYAKARPFLCRIPLIGTRHDK